MSDPRAAVRHQTAIGASALLLGALMAFGASTIPSTAGYAGVGPNFLPWVVSLVLVACGVFLLMQARSGGWRDMEEPSGAERGDWQALAWVAAGVAANAALITWLAAELRCPKRDVQLLRGEASRRKQVRLDLPEQAVATWLDRVLCP